MTTTIDMQTGQVIDDNPQSTALALINDAIAYLNAHDVGVYTSDAKYLIAEAKKLYDEAVVNGFSSGNYVGRIGDYVRSIKELSDGCINDYMGGYHCMTAEEISQYKMLRIAIPVASAAGLYFIYRKFWG